MMTNDILFWNANSLRSSDRLPTLELLTSQTRYLAIAVCETKVPASVSLRLKGHHCVSVPQRAKNAGGVCIFVHNTVPFRRNDALTFPPVNGVNALHNSRVYPQCVAVELRVSASSRVTLVCVYVPPQSHELDVKRMLDLFRPFDDPHHHVLLVGDFNAKHASWSLSNANPFGTLIHDWSAEHHYTVLNSLLPEPEPTYRGPAASTLDLAICSDASFVDRLSVQRSLPLASNHWPVCVRIGSSAVPEPAAANPLPHTRRWKLDEADWNLYAAELEAQLPFFDDFAGSLEAQAASGLISYQRAVDRMADRLSDYILSCADASVPRTSGRSAAEPRHRDWWGCAPDVQSAYDAMRAAYRRHSAHPNSRPKHEAYLVEKRKWRSIRRAAIQSLNAKRAAALESPDRPSTFWPAYRQVRGSCSTNVPLSTLHSSLAPAPVPAPPPSFQTGVDTMAAHFAAASSLPAAPDPDTSAQVHHQLHGDDQGLFPDSWAGPVSPSFDPSEADPLHPDFSHLPDLNKDFTVVEVSTLLSRLSTKTSVGPDCIPFALLKHGGERLATSLCALINFSWRHSAVPQAWRDADVIALYKQQGDVADCDNYRPISLTSVIARTIERLIAPRLYKVVDPRLSVWQSGFRQKRSTTDQILAVVERVRLAFSHNLPLPVAFLDIKKAFDRVWHDGLMFKLFVHFRVAGRCWMWILAFLTGRRLRVRAKGLVSAWHSVLHGVPQGSVLAPLLFLIFINDLAEAIDRAGCDAPLFADDTALLPKLSVRKADQHRVMQAALDATFRWSICWRVQWGIKKCGLVVFSRSRTRPAARHWLLRLGNESLPRVDHYLYLGVFLQERLSWDLQYAKVLKTTQFVAWKVARWVRQAEALNRVTLPVVRQLVLACVRSSFGYALPIWRPTSAQVNSLQRHVLYPLRCCLHLPRTTSIPGLLIECAIPDTHIWIQHLGLRLARRVIQLPPTHSARACWDYWRNAGVPIDRVESARFFVSLPFAQLIFAIEARWFGIDEIHYYGADDVYALWADVSNRNLKLSTTELLLRCYLQAVLDDRCEVLRDVKPQPGLSAYLKMDSRSTSVHRARLRLDRALTHANMYQRKLADSPYCPSARCHRQPETVQHLLLHCPRYQRDRSKLSALLRDHDLDLSLALILGEWGPAVRKNDEVVAALNAFLLAVHKKRAF